MAATAALMITQLGGAFAQSEAQKAQASFQESQAKINSMFAEMQYNDALRRGDKQARQYQKQASKIVGSQKATLAAQGIDIDVGTAADIQEETREAIALDVNEIRNNAYRQAFGFKQESLSQKFQGEIAKMTGDFRSQQTLITGGLQAFNTGVAGAYDAGYFGKSDTKSKGTT